MSCRDLTMTSTGTRIVSLVMATEQYAPLHIWDIYAFQRIKVLLIRQFSHVVNAGQLAPFWLSWHTREVYSLDNVSMQLAWYFPVNKDMVKWFALLCFYSLLNLAYHTACMTTIKTLTLSITFYILIISSWNKYLSSFDKWNSSKIHHWVSDDSSVKMYMYIYTCI